RCSLRHQYSEHIEPRKVRLKATWFAGSVTPLDAPTIQAEVMVALVAFQLRKFRPALCVLNQKAHSHRQCSTLPHRPFTHTWQRVSLRRLRLTMMSRLVYSERRQFEREIRVPRGDHVVVHNLIRILFPEVACQTHLRPRFQVFRVLHPLIDTVLMTPRL